MAMIDKVQALLPDRWHAEEVAPNDRHVIIIAPNSRSAVTVDVDARFYKLGYGIAPPRPYDMAKKYHGRGWFERLVADAVAALQDGYR